MRFPSDHRVYRGDHDSSTAYPMVYVPNARKSTTGNFVALVPRHPKKRVQPESSGPAAKRRVEKAVAFTPEVVLSPQSPGNTRKRGAADESIQPGPRRRRTENPAVVKSARTYRNLPREPAEGVKQIPRNPPRKRGAADEIDKPRARQRMESP